MINKLEVRVASRPRSGKPSLDAKAHDVLRMVLAFPSEKNPTSWKEMARLSHCRKDVLGACLQELARRGVCLWKPGTHGRGHKGLLTIFNRDEGSRLLAAEKSPSASSTSTPSTGIRGPEAADKSSRRTFRWHVEDTQLRTPEGREWLFRGATVAGLLELTEQARVWFMAVVAKGMRTADNLVRFVAGMVRKHAMERLSLRDEDAGCKLSEPTAVRENPVPEVQELVLDLAARFSFKPVEVEKVEDARVAARRRFRLEQEASGKVRWA